MSKHTLSFLTVIGLAIYALLAAGSTQCSRQDKPMSYIEFVGRVENTSYANDDNKKIIPLNNRLVIVYKNGKEVGRGVTELGKYEGIDEVPNDGLFKILTENEYQLTQKELEDIEQLSWVQKVGTKSRATSLGEGALGNKMYIGMQSLSENKFWKLNIKERTNVNYTILAIPGQFNSLPEDLKNDEYSTILTSENKVVVLTKEGVPQLEILNTIFDEKEEEVKIKEYEFPFNNCGGNSELSQRYFHTEAYLHEKSFNVETNTKARIPALWLAGIDLSAQLKTQYGFVEKQMSEETIEYTFKVGSRSNVTYKIAWYEVWKTGKVKVKTENGPVDIPFKVKIRLKYKVESKRNPC